MVLCDYINMDHDRWKDKSAAPKPSVEQAGKDAFKQLDEAINHIEKAIPLFTGARDYLSGWSHTFREMHRDVDRLVGDAEEIERDANKIRMDLWKYR